MSKIISVSEEIFTHEYLWRIANLMLKTAKQDERDSFYYLLSALLISYMAFEAFVNFSGYILFPNLWGDEKKYFKGKGDVIEAKISKLQEKLKNYEWKKGERPYQNIKKLKKFRDSVVHGKVQNYHYEAMRKADGSHIEWKLDWYNYNSIENLESLMNDIKYFCQSLLELMRKQSKHPHLLFDAFEGPLGSAKGSSDNKVG